MGSYPFKLDGERLLQVIGSVPMEIRKQLGYDARKPTPEEQQDIINAIADEVIQKAEFRQAVTMRLLAMREKKVTE